MSLDNAHRQDLAYWQQLQQGSPEALEALYDKFFPQLFRYGMQLVADRSMVQDSLQDFFVELYTRHASLSNVRQVRSYLYVSFRRKLLRLYQKQQRFISYTQEKPSSCVESHEQSLVLQQLGETQLALLSNAFRQLSHRQKEALFLRFYEEMDYEEIAAVLKLKEVKYARTLIYRSITALRQALSNHKASLTLYAGFPFGALILLFRS